MQKEKEPMRVLVIDDEELIRELLEEFLTVQGFDVTTALDGKDALIKFDAVHPHVVLLDIRMPDMTGIDVLRVIRERDPQAGVIMLSAYGDSDTIAEALETGADHYFEKPIDLMQLSEFLGSFRSRMAQGVQGEGCQN